MNAPTDLLDDETLNAPAEARGPRGIQSIEVGGLCCWPWYTMAGRWR
jgi:hypothetical protein